MSAVSTLDQLVDRVRGAVADHTPLRLRGAGSKDFYGGMLVGDVLNLSGFAGIVAYEPTELYLTARCGTPIAEIEAALAEQGQMLACEPPRFAAHGPGATLGGAVACGLSGPRRQQVGALRDFVLGVQVIDGRAEVLNFGGQVMKNVAGYDVSRLMAGAFGTLGVLSEITVKVLPRPVAETTLRFDLPVHDALTRLNQWGGRPLPISASFWHDEVLSVRLSGAAAAVDAARRQLGGQAVADAAAFWESVREQTHAAFATQPSWRLALPSTASDLAVPGLRAIEWGGGLRWYASEDGAALRAAASQAGGHAVCYRASESLRCREGVFSPLSGASLALHRRLKKAFDPAGIFNPGRLYAEF